MDETKERLAATKRDNLKGNPKVDAATVAAYERLERKLKKLGVEVKTGYRLEPPLGAIGPRLQSRNR